MKTFKTLLFLFLLTSMAFGDDFRLPRLASDNDDQIHTVCSSTNKAIVVYREASNNFHAKVFSKSNGALLLNFSIPSNSLSYLSIDDTYIAAWVNSTNKMEIYDITNGTKVFDVTIGLSLHTNQAKAFGSNLFFYGMNGNNEQVIKRLTMGAFNITTSAPVTHLSGDFGNNYLAIIDGLLVQYNPINYKFEIYSNGITNPPTFKDMSIDDFWLQVMKNNNSPAQFIFNADSNNKYLYWFDNGGGLHGIDKNLSSILRFQINNAQILSWEPASFNNLAYRTATSDNFAYINGVNGSYFAKLNTSTLIASFNKVESKFAFGDHISQNQNYSFFITLGTSTGNESFASIVGSQFLLAYNPMQAADLPYFAPILADATNNLTLTSNLESNEVTLLGGGNVPVESLRSINTLTNLSNKYFIRWKNILDGSTFSYQANLTNLIPFFDGALEAEYGSTYTSTILSSVGGQVSGTTGVVDQNTVVSYTATASAHYDFSYFEVMKNGVLFSVPNTAPFNVSPYAHTFDSNVTIKGIFTEHTNYSLFLQGSNVTYTINSNAQTSIKLYATESAQVVVAPTDGKTIVGLYDENGNIYWGTDITFQFANMSTNLYLNPLYQAPMNGRLTLEFNDLKISQFADGLTTFHDTTSSPKIPVPKMNLGANETNKLQFVYNSFGGTALAYNSISGSDFYLVGPTLYKIGDKFAMESHLKLSEAPVGEIVFMKDELCTCFEFKLLQNGELSLHLYNEQGGIINVQTTNANTPIGSWVNIGLKVDLSKTTLNEIVTIYKNNVALALNAITFDSSFTLGTVGLKKRARPIKVLSFTNNKNFIIDDLILYMNANQTTIDGFPLNFKGGEKSVNVQPGASGSIYIFNDFLTPIQNKMGVDGVSPAGTIIPDIAINQPGVFHGVFQFKLGLEFVKFDGNLIIDYFIKRPEDAVFKKIGQKSFTKEPGTISEWDTYFYWDSKKALFDWTAEDTKPYKSTGPVQFKFELR